MGGRKGTQLFTTAPCAPSSAPMATSHEGTRTGCSASVLSTGAHCSLDKAASRALLREVGAEGERGAECHTRGLLRTGLSCP